MGVEGRSLTELEGAILSEIEHRGHRTAFQVRRAFAESFSLEWRGSAGAVYPAVRRLEGEGLLSASEPTGGRRARSLALTAIGREALMTWARDPALSSSSGVDPFRLRAGIWSLLPKPERNALLSDVAAHIEQQIALIESHVSGLDPVETIRIELALEHQRDRLRQIERWR
ncbi:PadR family transcriptional regulator [Sphingomonas sp. Leaf21]|uniref:PadR family transcriptional regulator n=1 Tax=Sphingomonas sp. Leaf21 TaxID=2876550 RepID=UPI001E5E689F|nr:PadR family transcriptional regulator [Sphingomonas sp. Leaf21]